MVRIHVLLKCLFDPANLNFKSNYELIFDMVGNNIFNIFNSMVENRSQDLISDN